MNSLMAYMIRFFPIGSLDLLQWLRTITISMNLVELAENFFKNSYCPFIRKRYFSNNISDERVRDGAYGTVQTPAWFGPNVKACRQEEETEINKIVAQNNHGKVLARLNGVRLQRLRRMFASVTNNYARYCTKIDPLMDRSVILSISQDSPIPHCMFCWDRREITNAYPKLAGIETDTGLSCRYTIGAVVRDALVGFCKK